MIQHTEKRTWRTTIPISEIQVGDYCRALVNCKTKRRRFHSNCPNREFRNGEVTGIFGKVIQLECAKGGTVAVMQSDIQSVWGYR